MLKVKMYIKKLIRPNYPRFIPNKMEIGDKKINKNQIWTVINETDLQNRRPWHERQLEKGKKYIHD